MAWLLSLTLPSSSGAQPQSLETPGIKIGQSAPSFTLTDQHGKQQTLQQLIGDNKGVALVFHRSADW